jgi:hypothetical protein
MLTELASITSFVSPRSFFHLHESLELCQKRKKSYEMRKELWSKPNHSVCFVLLQLHSCRVHVRTRKSLKVAMALHGAPTQSQRFREKNSELYSSANSRACFEELCFYIMPKNVEIMSIVGSRDWLCRSDFLSSNC